jgi:hypothetical protein
VHKRDAAFRSDGCQGFIDEIAVRPRPHTGLKASRGREIQQNEILHGVRDPPSWVGSMQQLASLPFVRNFCYT